VEGQNPESKVQCPVVSDRWAEGSIHRRESKVQWSVIGGQRAVFTARRRARREINDFLFAVDPGGIGSAFHRAGRTAKRNRSIQLVVSIFSYVNLWMAISFCFSAPHRKTKKEVPSAFSVYPVGPEDRTAAPLR